MISVANLTLSKRLQELAPGWDNHIHIFISRSNVCYACGTVNEKKVIEV